MPETHHPMDRTTHRRTNARRGSALFAAFAVIALALAPAIAEARPGGSISSGSRGSRTYSAPPSTQTAPSGGTQFQRTETPRPSPGVAQTAPRPGMATPAPAGGFFSRNPLMAGLMGGLLGAGLFGLLSGHGLFGGMAGFAGFFGLLLQIGLIVGLVFLVMRLLRGRQQPAMAGGPQGYAYAQPTGPGRGPMGGPVGLAAGGAAPTTRSIEVGPADYQAFERALVDVNAAWSRQDVDALSRLSTPEMTRIFSQDLQDLKARGWTNVTRDVKLEAGDLSEAWSENGQDYATVAMRFSLLDFTTDATGRVVEGSPTDRQTVTELWTFTRRAGGPWILSAIQQAG
ncbi:Tim44 domain-containing protein [Falsiroseomonas sp. HW251]|uniref:Tim44 domain-containing protein n=1 Tax=Falsiroseomonas sp. HW251 TaxID=3390998 RepID=UPI003D314CAE